MHETERKRSRERDRGRRVTSVTRAAVTGTGQPSLRDVWWWLMRSFNFQLAGLEAESDCEVLESMAAGPFFSSVQTLESVLKECQH